MNGENRVKGSILTTMNEFARCESSLLCGVALFAWGRYATYSIEMHVRLDTGWTTMAHREYCAPTTQRSRPNCYAGTIRTRGHRS